MTTIDGSTAERLAALERRNSAPKGGKRRRPAEASRVLAAGAGTAAVLTMVAAMAQADQPVEVVESPVFETQAATTPLTFDAGVSPPSTFNQAPQATVVQTITVARPVRAQASNARTSASR